MIHTTFTAGIRVDDGKDKRFIKLDSGITDKPSNFIDYNEFLITSEVNSLICYKNTFGKISPQEVCNELKIHRDAQLRIEILKRLELINFFE